MTDPDSIVSKVVHTPEDSPATVPPHAPHLAPEQDILARFRVAFRACGVVGEDATAAIVFLSILSQLLDEPVSLVVKGSSSSGKSKTVQTVTRFFPRDAVIELTGMSERALVFEQREFKHRSIVVYEAVALRERAEQQSGNLTSYFVRSLISEGRISYPMSVRTKDGEWTTKVYEKEGPTNVILTTTQVHLHNENETRLLSLNTNDSAEQTQRVLVEIAREARNDVDLESWRQLSAWLRTAERRVTIPFAEYLAQHIPPVAVRLRRDFRSVLSLIRAHAVLHQATRGRDDAGRIVATEADYMAVRALILPVVSQGVGATVSSTVRETGEAVEALHSEHPEGVPASVVAQALKLDRSAARRRLIVACDAGYALNLEERRGRPGRYVPGDPLPDELLLLPLLPPRHPEGDESAGQAGDGTVAAVSEGVGRDDEDLAERLLRRELGATDHPQADTQAEFVRAWNADVYAQAKARREAEEGR